MASWRTPVQSAPPSCSLCSGQGEGTHFPALFGCSVAGIIVYYARTQCHNSPCPAAKEKVSDKFLSCCHSMAWCYIKYDLTSERLFPTS